MCALLLAAAGSAEAQPTLPRPEPRPERLSVELGLHGAAVLNHDLDASPTGGGRFTLRLLWPLGSRVRLGLRMGLLMTALPYGQPSNDIWLGVQPEDPDAPYAAQVVTLVPSVSFLFQVRIWRGLELDLTAGLGAPLGVWKTGEQATQVAPVLGLGLLYYVYRHPDVHVALRFGFDALPIVGKHPRQAWLFIPMGGVLVRIPVRDKLPAEQKRDAPGPFDPRYREEP